MSVMIGKSNIEIFAIALWNVRRNIFSGVLGDAGTGSWSGGMFTRRNPDGDRQVGVEHLRQRLHPRTVLLVFIEDGGRLSMLAVTTRTLTKLTSERQSSYSTMAVGDSGYLNPVRHR